MLRPVMTAVVTTLAVFSPVVPVALSIVAATVPVPLSIPVAIPMVALTLVPSTVSIVGPAAAPTVVAVVAVVAVERLPAIPLRVVVAATLDDELTVAGLRSRNVVVANHPTVVVDVRFIDHAVACRDGERVNGPPHVERLVEHAADVVGLVVADVHVDARG